MFHMKIIFSYEHEKNGYFSTRLIFYLFQSVYSWILFRRNFRPTSSMDHSFLMPNEICDKEEKKINLGRKREAGGGDSWRKSEKFRASATSRIPLLMEHPMVQVSCPFYCFFSSPFFFLSFFFSFRKLLPWEVWEEWETQEREAGKPNGCGSSGKSFPDIALTVSRQW